MKYLKISFLCFLLISCKNTSEENRTDQESNLSETQNGNYQNDDFGFGLQLNPSWEILESEEDGNPIINIYKKDNSSQPPYAIHENAEIGFISILPEGLPVDGLSGQSVNLLHYDNNPFKLDAIDEKESLVYLLEDGNAYAFYIHLKEEPENWKNYGGIFIHPRVANFKGICYDENGNEKALEDCDEFGGSDSIKFSGEVDMQQMQDLIEIMNSFQFKISEKQPVSELIKVSEPLPDLEIQSPITIKGRAKGFWFFEATAPVELVDSKGKEIAQGYIKTDGDWMTKDWVNFSGEMEFEIPDDENGYLVFYRSNPSGEAEHAQMFKMPVTFHSKE